jgi:alpha-L-rhamnosidase
MWQPKGKRWWSALCTWALVGLVGLTAQAVEVKNLRCEYLTDPLGIDVVKPRLSWTLESPERGECQKAYQVRVAASQKDLDAEQGGLWDSGKIESDQSIQVEYAGKPLTTGAACFWKVRVWGVDGKPSAWSQPARWTMGLLEPSSWTAKWIGWDHAAGAEADSDLKPVFAKASWIWPAGEDFNTAAPEPRFFRRTFDLPEGKTLKKAMIALSADNGFKLFVNGKEALQGDNFKAPKQADLLSLLKPGRNVLAVEVQNVGPNANPAGLIATLVAVYEDGQKVTVASDKEWKVGKSTDTNWNLMEFDGAKWVSSQVVGQNGMQPWGQIDVTPAEQRELPARYLRRDFEAPKAVKAATISVSGLGYYEVYLNGAKVGDHVLDPVLTDYDKRVNYVTYDVTKQVKQGANAVGAILGNGRYFAPRLGEPIGTRTFGFPKLLCQLDIEYADGSKDRVVSDTQWKLTTDGPIRENNDYDGEVYDATMELGQWATAGYDAKAWKTAENVQAPAGKLVAQMMPPMRVTEKIKPKKLTSPKPGVWVFDMGQNMVGWCQLTVSAPKGTRIQLRHAETLSPGGDGTLYVANLRGAKCRDIYVSKGAGKEVYTPRFTYHGFRFVEITGLKDKPDLSTIEGQVVHTDLPRAGEFECSNPLVNQIHKNVFWGTRGNYLSMPTDCPQRDERQGWQGDRAAESKGETFLFETVTLYNKWLQDIEDSQKPDGNLSDVCPNFWSLYGSNVTWPSAFTIVPQSLYNQYGEARNIPLHYEAQKRWMEHLAGFIKDDLIDKDNYGDWCVPPEDPILIHSKDPARQTSKMLLATSYYIMNLRLLAQYGDMQGKKDEAAAFRARADKMQAAFNKKFLNAEGNKYDNGTQSSCVLPLMFDLVPQEKRGAIFQTLLDNINNVTKGHIGTGLIGGQWLNRVLTEQGRADLSWKFVTNEDYPSWGYMVKNGATTVWELWNGNTADPAMNSGNHVMLVGDLIIWMYENLAGIQSDPAKPGFKHVIMKPQPVKGADFVRAEYRSMHGPIRSAWKVADGAFNWEIKVPTNATATVYVPAASADAVTEGGKKASEAKGVKFVKMEGDRAVFEIGSGAYQFKASQAGK